ncbi:MAG TPA: nickel insertion protein, partial [Polyangiaceae bacterium]|nr:nickel insertion protein [Polyangiaceae bacterium]
MGHEGHEHDEHGAQGHEHAHGHAHMHEHGHGAPELARGAGAGHVLFLDAPSGLAGDMIIAALVDLGVPRKAIADALVGLPVTGYHLHFGTRVRSGVVATAFEVHVDEGQPARTYGSIRAMLEASALAPAIKTRALGTFRR